MVSESKYFRDKLSRHYFFSTKTIFFKAQSANRIFVSAHFTDRICFSIKFPNRNFFLTKNHSPPPFKLNGCSLKDNSTFVNVDLSRKYAFLMDYQLLIDIIFMIDVFIIFILRNDDAAKEIKLIIE